MAHVRKLKSGKWQATVRHPSGQRWSKSDPLKRVVQQWASDKEAEIRRGQFIDPTAGKITLSQWWGEWTSTRRVEVATEKKNSSHWRVHVEPAFGDWPLTAIQSWDVEKWVTEMQGRNVGKTTIAASLNLLRHLLNAAVKHRLIGANPAAIVDAPSVPRHKDRFLTPAEAARIVDQLEGTDRLFVQVLFGTGLRWGEAAALDGRHIQLLRKVISVEQALDRSGQVKAPKTDAGHREVPISDELTDLLARHVVNLSKPVFLLPSGKRFGYSNWRSRVWVPAVKRARIADPQPTPHDCRHSYGSWLGEAGVPVHEIAALMGHSDWRMTQRYVHASEARFNRARAALSSHPSPLMQSDERQESGRRADHHRTS